MKITLISLHGLLRGRDLEIGRDADNGGQIIYVMELARALQSRHDVDHVTLITRLIDDPALASDYACPIERVTEKFTIRRVPFAGPRYLLKEQLWNHLDEFVSRAEAMITAQRLAPNFLHSHYADAGYAAAALSRRLGIPFIHSGHSLGRRKLEKLVLGGMAEEEAMERFRFRQRFAAEETTLRQAAFIICSTRQEIESYGDYENARAARYEVLPPGIDVRRFAPSHSLPMSRERRRIRRRLGQRLRRFLQHHRKPMILAVCRPDQKKNLQGLIAAYATQPELRAKANLIVCAGQRDDVTDLASGERETIVDMLTLLDRHDLYGQMALPKRHDPDLEVPELYRLAAETGGVFANVAFDEPFGLTLLEAAASGLPVIATDQGGPTEILSKLGNGELVDPTDRAAIQRAMMKILNEPHLRQVYAKRGLARLAEHYSWDAHVARYVETVRPLIAGGRSRGNVTPLRLIGRRRRPVRAPCRTLAA